MNIRDRIKQYIEYKGITDYKFEKDLSLSKGYTNKVKNPTSDMLIKMCGIYTDLSANWLLTGEGSMLKSENLSTIKQRLDYYIAESKINPDDFCKAIEMSDIAFREIRGTIPDDKLKKIKELFPSLDIEWLMIGEGNMLKSEMTFTQSIDSSERIKELEEENIALKAENKVLRELAGLGVKKDSSKSA